MNTPVFEQFDVMNKETLSAIEGGKMGDACLSAGAASLAAGAGALASSAVPVVSMYLGAQALATGATLYSCLR
ncbi:bacteriocin class II family protein [Streptococcus macacae]|uniref:Bacteriocin class II with double-glycine leader peptide n=1 Tax=Streptococcus macacae NCTC 11558 TaxID=764298 RepID=G5JXF5_9STRE|nr:bacteriocin class II family protein [Streptococcus macacae]EHJ53016.1 bacteriocin class II with double-glycine leader peptide [Streptococcus macacae NCTC 11558]SUN79218.1 Bacteriocin class II with double-glycine leader peptide [Streptococcus macacae NCTC 11558]